MMKRVVKVAKDEFELDDGSVFPIIPPLSEEMSVDKFQEHYERACNLVQSIKDIGSDNENSPQLG